MHSSHWGTFVQNKPIYVKVNSQGNEHKQANKQTKQQMHVQTSS